MKLEIDIDEDYYKIICKRVKENKPYHSSYEYEVIADGKPLEQEPQTFKWCTDCKEYDQEKYCCHRWSKAIRDTVEEMKQEYIEREVLDKIRTEIERQEKWLMDAGYNQYNVDIALDTIKSLVDKYKAETEAEDG